MNLTRGIIFLICAIAFMSCQKEDDLFLEETTNLEVTDNSFENEVSSKSSVQTICYGIPIPEGYIPVQYVYRNFCPYIQGMTFNAIVIKKDDSPRIINAGAGCDDNYCIWIVGENFEPDAYIDIRTTTGETIIGTYRGADRQINISPNGDDTMSIRLRTDLERSEFASRGLRIWVVNPEARKWADGRTVKRPGNPNPNDDCNGGDCIDP
ncbi:hypothetical protein M0D21_00205 [Aquimarina sp. D1M17]|uniref:hypothetical protein n=1 Tax=Aquimarina acroporae TaxID=2937283 RepID=UPI0020C16669|nr:hypothetical protein [Aquimarina acroporae]MCK8519970.1 hypothetical protein [Aquimarina acroporae]